MLRDRWIFGRKTPGFTLQWHLTNACPFHCRHCYDRSWRAELALPQAMRVLEDLRRFCARHRVEPRVSLSGGDPLCYGSFWELYQALAEAKIAVSILGNPLADEALQRLLAVRKPAYYQVSLEGLREHNDFMRGEGHFQRTLAFLETARRQGLRTHVMLTLSRANLDQVLPLGERLRGLAHQYTFNRLSCVGEAAGMAQPSREEYVAFLRHYLAACRDNAVLGIKDNLFNIIRHHFGRKLFRGCTGFGCGAAFNFVALLPDGEVHACRKFPSPLGNVLQASLEEIYQSPQARRYRQGSAACQGCRLRKSCGGCLAVTHGCGLDPLNDRDPYCFLAERETLLAGF